jgi:hypothetical protein
MVDALVGLCRSEMVSGLCCNSRLENSSSQRFSSPRGMGWKQCNDDAMALRWKDGNTDGPMSCASLRGSSWTCAREVDGGERSYHWWRGKREK